MKTNKTEARRARMMERTQQHGETLLDLFPNASERDPVKLCKKLRRLELKANNLFTAYCNGEVSRADDGEGDLPGESAIESALVKLLGLTPAACRECGLFLNSDPRGYSLKIADAYAYGFNKSRAAQGLPCLYRDLGGYGILAPDLSND